MSDVRLRDCRREDLDALYAISLATGDAGGDASALYTDRKLIGHVYVGPYAALCPELAMVAVDAAGVGGYIVGTSDTRAFERRQESEWWPALRAAYPDLSATAADRRTADQQRCFRIHHPPRMPDWLVGPYPAHLHINLLPRLQGRGVGRRLVRRWIERVRTLGATGVHLGVNVANRNAMGFYAACGFRELAERAPDMPRAVWFVRDLRLGG